jgi:hypothetical protein
MSIQGDSRGPIGSAFSVDLNAVADTFVPTPSGPFILRNFTVTNASTTLAASSMTIGGYTGAAATGVTLVTPATATTLTSASVFKDQTVAASTAVITPTYNTTAGKYGVYVRVAVVHGSAATADVYLYGDIVTNA